LRQDARGMAIKEICDILNLHFFFVIRNFALFNQASITISITIIYDTEQHEVFLIKQV